MEAAATSIGCRVSKRWSLQAQTALVIGGTRGLGYAIVEELAGLGATVHTCSRNEAELEKYLKGWKELGVQVTGSAEREKLIETVSSQFNGKLNILINNAGTNVFKPTVEF